MATPTGTVSAAATGSGGAHTWEETDAAHAWENAVVEDAEGRIVAQDTSDSLTALLRRRRRRLEQNDYALRNKRLRRDMIRYVYIVLDASRWMREKDVVLGTQTRLEATIEMLTSFCPAFFDENPLSHLGFVLVRNGEAEVLSKLSSHAKPHKLALQSVAPLIVKDANHGGEFSLQNGLEVAGRSLGHQPRHGSREILVLTAALSTCDPGFVLTETLPRLKQAKVRVSAYSLTAELHVVRKITHETAGSMGVCLDRTHFVEWLRQQTVPPPSLFTSSSNNDTTLETTCEMVAMGFPSRTVAPLPSLVHALRDKTILSRTAYTCPQCQAKNAELPTDCAVCGLKLVLSPHLARSFHHLFPVPQFAQVTTATTADDDEQGGSSASVAAAATSSSSATVNVPTTLNNRLVIDSKQDDTCCFACNRPLWSTKSSETNAAEPSSAEWLRFACPECDNVFCFDCDAFLHESLHNCPGCLTV